MSVPDVLCLCILSLSLGLITGFSWHKVVEVALRSGRDTYIIIAAAPIAIFGIFVAATGIVGFVVAIRKLIKK